MAITTDNQIEYSSNLESVIFWAQDEDGARIRCLVPGDIVNDYFKDEVRGSAMVQAVKVHWGVIWPALTRKILNGHIHAVEHDHGQTMMSNRFQKISQVVPEPRDFGGHDFRGK